MNIWYPREASQALLDGPLAKERDLLAALLAMIRDQVGALERVESSLPRAAAAILGKAHRLSIGLYSLQLDALGQEAGALLRPLQEVSEVLAYLSDEPSRVVEVEEDRLPKAGIIAKRNASNLKPLRDHLSTHASHFAITSDAMGHYLDHELGRIQLDRSPSEDVLRRNLRSLAAFMVMCAVDGAVLMAHCGLDGEEHLRRLEPIRSELVSMQDETSSSTGDHR